MKQSKHLLATIVMLLCSLAANAYDFEVDGIYYNITDKSTQKVEVTYKSVTRSYSGSVEIPNSVVYGGDTYDVIAIGNMAFQQCTDLTSIVIPESVTSIAALAFNQCKKLESIIIPGNVNFIGRYAFQDCNNLTQMTCFSKTPPTCFDNTFANFQVSGCTLYVPAFSVSVYQSAEYWNEFTNIQPLSSNDIASGTCGTNLTWTLYTDGELIIEGTGAMNNYSSTDEVPWYGYETSIKIVTIKEGVTSIGNYAFEDCSSLTTITLPEGVTSIGENAFFGCSNLTSIDIPKGVESIGEYAFCACNLIRITISTSITSIGEAAFANNPNLAEIMVEQGNAHYDSRNNCNAIIETANGLLVAGCAATLIPEGVTAIGYGAFAGTKGLSSIFIPKNVNTIRANAFEYCDNLTEVNCAENSQLTSIGGYAFFGCISLTAISIPESVSSIGLGAFLGCSSLTAITSKATTPPTIGGSNTFNGVDKSIPVYVPAESVEAYKVAAFWKEFTNIIGMREVLASGTCGANLTWTLYVDGELVIEGNGDMTYSQNKAPWDKYTSSIEIVTIKKGVTSIGNWAFLYCGSLTSITIPESVTSIGISAFYECSSLTSITIPESVTSIGSSAFYGCNSLTSITIPKSVISIGNAAFCHCISLNSITIPASVTSIGNYAFDGCYSLTFITIPEGMTSIGEYVFRSCRSLTSITIPESVTEIGSSAFNGCSSLTSITIPASVTNIDVRTFSGCSSLTAITCKATTPPTIGGSNTFDGVDKSIPVYVPAESVEAYKAAEYWMEFDNILPIKESVESNITLVDGVDFEQESAEEYTGITYTRNFRNTNWQALYVPFEIPLTDEFLADFEVAYIYDVRQYDRDDDGVKDEIFIEAFKKKGGVLEANYPYLIRAKEAGEKTITVNDAILYATEENSYDCSSMFDTYTFTGTYHRMPANELTGCYALSGGVWQPVADDASLGAFRFYLKIETRSGEPVVNKARSIRMRIIDEDGNEEDGATRIDDAGLSVDNIETIIYDLQGRRITYTDNLKGVYIVNGKKVVF